MIQKDPFWEIRRLKRGAPSLHPKERLDWRGFHKKCPQNIDTK
jgi:hypothetical protein